eukprot:PhM_4_TR8440/c0_g1_i1/m.51239
MATKTCACYGGTSRSSTHRAATSYPNIFGRDATEHRYTARMWQATSRAHTVEKSNLQPMSPSVRHDHVTLMRRADIATSRSCARTAAYGHRSDMLPCAPPGPEMHKLSTTPSCMPMALTKR